jgi:PAS domain S-box-containing protein
MGQPDPGREESTTPVDAGGEPTLPGGLDAFDLLDNLTAEAAVLDTDLRVRAVNRTTVNAHGPAEGLIGGHCYEVFCKGTAPCEDCPAKKALETGSAARVLKPRSEAAGRDGEWVALHALPLRRRGEDRAAGLLVRAMDAPTALVNQEAFLQHEALYRRMLETSPEAVLVGTTGGVITLANEQCARLHGYDAPDELAGKHFSELVHPDDRERVLRLARDASGGEPLRGVGVRLLRRDGSAFEAEVSASEYMDESGRRLGFLALARDVTRQREAERTIRSAQEHLEERVAERTRELEETNAALQEQIAARRQMEAEIRYRLGLEQALSEAMRILGSARNPDFSDAMGLVGRAAQVDRLGVFLEGVEPTVYHLRHVWTRPGQGGFLAPRGELHARDFPWVMEQFAEADALRIDDRETLPPEAGAAAAFMREQDIRAALLVPLRIRGREPAGFMFMHQARGPRCWVQEDIQALGFLGEHFMEIANRQRAEEALRASEEKYRAVVEGMGVPAMILDEAMRIRFLNNTGAERLGVDPERALGQRFREILPDDVAGIIAEPARRALNESRPWTGEERVEFGGRLRWFQVSVLPVGPLPGAPGSVLVLAREITESREAAEQLRLFRRLMDQSSDALFVLDAETARFLDVNETACETLGRGREDLLAMTIDEIDCSYTDAETWVAHTERLQDGAPGHLRTRFRRSDGTTFPVDVTGRFVRHGGREYVVATARDITDQLASEAALRQSEAQYRSLAESAIDGIVIVQDGRVVFANQRMGEILGRDVEAIVGRPYEEFIWPEERERLRENYRRRLRGESVPDSYETAALHADGSHLPIEISAAVIPRGESTATLAYIRDITERKQTQEALVRAERLAAIGTLAGGVAHEFNNINVSILGFSQLALENPDLDDELRDWLSRIRRGAQRAGTITRNLLTFSRGSPASDQQASLVDVVENTLQLVGREFEIEGIVLDLRLRPIPETQMDPSQIGQVVLNLLINARHALMDRPDPTITITTGRAPHPPGTQTNTPPPRGYIYVSFADNGCGIEPHTLERIFTPFFSTKGEHAESSGGQSRIRGSGLGLSISHAIVEEHGGEIRVQSAPGEGSIFTVWLPIRHPIREDEAGESGPAADDRPRPRLLVCDPKQDVRDLVRALLDRRQCDILVAATPDQALDLLKSEPIDLLVTPLRSDDGDQAGFLDRAAALGLEEPPRCIVLTATDPTRVRRRFPRLRIVEVLNRPFELSSFCEAVLSATSDPQRGRTGR